MLKSTSENLTFLHIGRGWLKKMVFNTTQLNTFLANLPILCPEMGSKVEFSRVYCKQIKANLGPFQTFSVGVFKILSNI